MDAVIGTSIRDYRDVDVLGSGSMLYSPVR